MKSTAFYEISGNSATFFKVIEVARNCGLVSAPSPLDGPFKAVLHA
jgi:hypothetical protein